MPTYTPLTIPRTAGSVEQTFDNNLDNAFGAGIDIIPAYFITPGGLSRTGNVVVGMTAITHGIKVGDAVRLDYPSTVDNNFPSGYKTVTAVTSNTFQYVEAGPNVSSSQSVNATQHIVEMNGYSSDSVMGLKVDPKSLVQSVDPNLATTNRNLTRSLFKLAAVSLFNCFNVTPILVNQNSFGLFPYTATLNTLGGMVVFFVSGSGYSITPNTTIGLNLTVDGNPSGACQVFTNEASSHKSFVPLFIVINNLAAGSHSVSLSLISGTSVDSTDTVNLTTLEFPINT